MSDANTWQGCGECDCSFPCHNGEERCIRLPLRTSATACKGVQECVATERRAKGLEAALRMIAGELPCIDNLMGDKDIARAALNRVEEA